MLSLERLTINIASEYILQVTKANLEPVYVSYKKNNNKCWLYIKVSHKEFRIKHSKLMSYAIVNVSLVVLNSILISNLEYYQCK